MVYCQKYYFWFVLGFALQMIPLLSQESRTGKIQGVVLSSIDHSPIYGANVVLEGTYIGTVSDSLGRFSIDHVSYGRYDLKLSAIGYKRVDTIITVESPQASKLTIMMNGPCEYDSTTALADIKAGTPQLLLVGSIAPIANTPTDDAFEKKYGVKYYDFGCTPPADTCIRIYNNLIFAYLDGKFGREWRNEVRQDVRYLSN